MKNDTMNKFKLLGVSLILAAVGVMLAGCGTLKDAPASSVPPPPDESEGIVEKEDGRVAAELVADPAEIGLDGQVVLRVLNRGESGLSFGRPITVERWEESGWIETDESRNAAWTMELLFVASGEGGVEQPWPFLREHRPEPGWYRFTKQVQGENTSGDAPRLVVRERVQVVDPGQ